MNVRDLIEIDFCVGNVEERKNYNRNFRPFKEAHFALLFNTPHSGSSTSRGVSRTVAVIIRLTHEAIFRNAEFHFLRGENTIPSGATSKVKTSFVFSNKSVSSLPGANAISNWVTIRAVTTRSSINASCFPIHEYVP
jgi:hypothetical protein